MRKWLRGVGCTLALLGIIFSVGCSRIQQTSTAEDRLEVRNDGTAIQWKYSDETDWHDLVALTELRGVSGENGKDGADGENGTDGTNGISGRNGADGRDGVNGKDGINGRDGMNGIDGKNGADGRDGIDGKDGADGINGKDGKDGINGTNGKDGRDGTDGKNGINGKNIEVKRAGNYIQWRYEDEAWQNLVALADITGPTGQKGVDGKTPEFRVNEDILQWRYVGDEIWLNIYDLSTLKGIDGEDGNTPFIGENGNWWIGTTDTGIKAAGTDGKDGKDGTNGINGIDGTDGKQIEIQKTDQYIQWRYEGGEWQNLVALADITGPAGQNGTDGEDGKTPEFRVDGNQLQWRYTGDTVWLNLYDLSTLKGADGKDGSCAGYFAANGSVYAWGTSLPFTVKKESGDLISYNSSDNKITLSKGHTYSLVFSGTVGVSAKSDDKTCGASLIDGYNSSEMAMETQTYMVMPKAGQSGRLTIAYNTVYTAEEDITLTFQYTNMLFQDTNFGGSQYHITIIALD